MTPYQPVTLKMKPGRYAWCSCGESKKQPFCDGSHGPTGMLPYYVEITEEKEVSWCVCKATNKKPFCDGTHKKMNQN